MICPRFHTVGRFIFVAMVLFGTMEATSQELEPRRWGQLPVGVSFVGGGYAFTTGEIELDPVLRVQGAETEIESSLFYYAHTFEFAEHVARFDFIQSYQDAHWSGLVAGLPRSRNHRGFSDTVLRFSMNLIGAPVLDPAEFAEYRKSAPKKNTIVGTGLALHLPTGAYDEDRALNVGSNRFTIRPQFGVVHSNGPWSFETTAAVWLYTDNTDYVNGSTLELDPLLAVQAHVVYSFAPGLWVSAGLGYGDGAMSTVNGISNDDVRRNLGWGFSAGLPIDRKTGIKIGYLGMRAQESIGNDTDTAFVAISRMW